VSKRVFHIADDVQRNALIRSAMQKAVHLAKESFYHALMVDALDDATLALFAQEGWERLGAALEFDYPQYARTLYVSAYLAAYRAAIHDLPHDQYPNTAELAAAFEAEQGFTVDRSDQRRTDRRLG
jgi:hypothetical protein